MLPHGADEDFPGKSEEILGETSADGHGILHEKGHDFQQLVIWKNTAGDFTGGLIQFPDDQFFPLLGVDDHKRGSQPSQIFWDVFNLEGARSHKAVAPRKVRGRDVPYLKRYDGAVEESEDPMDRAGEGVVQIHPAHRFREGDGGNQAGKNGRKELNGVLAFLFLAGADVFTLIRFYQLQFFNPDALAPGKAQSGLGRLPLLVERGALGCAQDFDDSAFLGRCHAAGGEDQPPGSPHRFDFFVGKALVLEFLFQEGLHILQRSGNEPGGDLFSSDL